MQQPSHFYRFFSYPSSCSIRYNHFLSFFLDLCISLVTNKRIILSNSDVLQCRTNIAVWRMLYRQLETKSLIQPFDIHEKKKKRTIEWLSSKINRTRLSSIIVGLLIVKSLGYHWCVIHIQTGFWLFLNCFAPPLDWDHQTIFESNFFPPHYLNLNSIRRRSIGLQNLKQKMNCQWLT